MPAPWRRRGRSPVRHLLRQRGGAREERHGDRIPTKWYFAGTPESLGYTPEVAEVYPHVARLSGGVATDHPRERVQLASKSVPLLQELRQSVSQVLASEPNREAGMNTVSVFNDLAPGLVYISGAVAPGLVL